MVGSKPYTKDHLGVAGNWMNTDGEKFAVTFDKKEPGRIHLKALNGEDEDDEEEQFLYLRESGDWVFLNMKEDSEDGESTTWYWAHIHVDDENEPLMLFAPNVGRFAELVRSGKIKGSVKEEKGGSKKVVQPDGREETVQTFPSLTVTIDAPDDKWVEEMVAGKFGVPLEWRTPIVLLPIDEDGEIRGISAPDAAPSVPESSDE